MSMHTKTTFELLPDEMILEICHYLHCSHILYSFFDLNSRLNQTITLYRQHVWFRRASYQQLLHLYEHILPRIGSTVLSLTIHPLHYASFPSSFQEQMSTIFPNLQMLRLTSWTSEYLLLSISNVIHNLKLLQKLMIEELSCSATIQDRKFIETIFSNSNSLLTNITFDYDCDSFNLTHPLMNSITSSHIRHLTIHLGTLKDLSILIDYIPNIYQLDVSFKNSALKPVPFHSTFSYLKLLSIRAIHYYSTCDDLINLFPIVPSIEQLSLILSTDDGNLINGEKLLAILPVQLKQFNYTVCYYAKKNYNQLNLTTMKHSWQSMSIAYSVSDIDKRIFLHTLPYSSSLLIIRSNLANNISRKDMHRLYLNVDRIQVYALEDLVNAFPIMGQCRRVRELTLLTAKKSMRSNLQDQSSANDNNQPIKLPCLPRLNILTIEGIPTNLHHLKDLFLAASNLSVLIIDLNCLLTVLDDEDESLLLYILLHQHILDLCIHIPDNITKQSLTTEQVHLIGRIFTHVRNLTLIYETSTHDIQSNLINCVLNEFPQLAIFHIYGKIPIDMIECDIRQWFIEQNYLRIKPTDIFRIECTNEWFKLWL